jgi:hypothetical protein
LIFLLAEKQQVVRAAKNALDVPLPNPKSSSTRPKSAIAIGKTMGAAGDVVRPPTSIATPPHNKYRLFNCNASSENIW